MIKLLQFLKKRKTLKAPASWTRKQYGSNGIGGGGGNDVVYKNTKENRFVNKTEIMGKLFLIQDKLPAYDWKLTSETKNIGVYTCYKATYTRARR